MVIHCPTKNNSEETGQRITHNRSQRGMINVDALYRKSTDALHVCSNVTDAIATAWMEGIRSSDSGFKHYYSILKIHHNDISCIQLHAAKKPIFNLFSPQKRFSSFIRAFGVEMAAPQNSVLEENEEKPVSCSRKFTSILLHSNL